MFENDICQKFGDWSGLENNRNVLSPAKRVLSVSEPVSIKVGS